MFFQIIFCKVSTVDYQISHTLSAYFFMKACWKRKPSFNFRSVLLFCRTGPHGTKKIPDGKIKTFVETSKPWSIFPDMFMSEKLHLLGEGWGVKSPVFELTEFVDEPLGSCHVSKEASVYFAKFYPPPSCRQLSKFDSDSLPPNQQKWTLLRIVPFIQKNFFRKSQLFADPLPL